MTQLTWSALLAAAGPDAPTAYEWMWQDLDGFHLEDLPPEPPLTSILWGWPRKAEGVEVSSLYRVRIDGQQVYAAQPVGGVQHEVLPWGALDQVAQARGAAGVTQEQIRQLLLIEVREAPPADGSVPLTFYARVASKP